jgi:chromosome segregation ATPase
MLVHLRNLVEEREGLLKYKNSLVDTKLALEESVSELMKTKAKVRMLEEELRRIRTMSLWRRLFWR